MASSSAVSTAATATNGPLVPPVSVFRRPPEALSSPPLPPAAVVVVVDSPAALDDAFGAAVVGRLRSLPLTNLGAYGIAVVASLFTKLASTRPVLAGVPTALPFVVLFIVLVFSPKGSFPEVGRAEVRRTGPRLRIKSLTMTAPA